MKILETVEVQLQWSDLDVMTVHEECPHTRTSGVHVSSLLKHVAIKSNTYTNDDKADAMPLRVLLGLSFEHYAARLYPNLLWQPGEYVLDDGIGCAVYGHLDGLEERGGTEWVVHEFKYTGRSLRRKGALPVNGRVQPEDFVDVRTLWIYMQQIASYINMVRELGLTCNKAWLHMCWKHGAYDMYPPEERYFKYLIEFDERDLTGNLMMIQANKDEVAL